MRKAKLPIAVLIVLVAVMLVFAGCINEEQITVTFSYPDGTTSSQTYEGSSPTIESEPEAKQIAGQVFEGWYLDEALTQAVTYPYSLSGVESLVLYAKYAEGYTITLRGGYGASQIGVSKEDPTVTSSPDPGTSPTGATFGGWYKNASFTQPVTFPYQVTGNEVWYAQWLQVGEGQAIVSLVGAYGDSSATFDIGDVIDADDLDEGNNPNDAEFLGWFLDSDFTQAVTFPYTIESNVTFYASWGEPEGFTVTFNTMGGDPMDPIVTTRIATKPIPTYAGYDFVNWYTNEQCSGRAVSFPYNVTRDVTLYAKWQEKLDPNATTAHPSTRGSYAAFQTLFEEYAQAVGGTTSDQLTIDLSAEVEGGVIELKADLMQGDGADGQMKPNSLLFRVEKDDDSTFGIYIKDNRLFIDTGGENGLYEVTDVQADYLALIISEVPGLLTTLIENANLDSALGMFGGLEGLISIVFNIFFENAQITEHTLNGTGALVRKDYAIEFKLNSFTAGITDILNLINLGALLGFDLQLAPLFEWIEEAIPQYKVMFNTSFSYDEDGNISVATHPSLDVTYNDPDQPDKLGQPAWNFGIADIAIGETVEIDFPDNIDAALAQEVGAVQEFSFTNLQFDIDLMLLTGSEDDGQGGQVVKQLDVGTLIGMFTDQLAIPEGMIKLESEFGFKLRAQVDLDLNYAGVTGPDGKLVDNNLILLELYTLNADGTLADKALGAYYKEGKLYVSLSSLIPNYWHADNIVVELEGLPEIINGIVTTVKTAIDDAILGGSDEGAATQSLSVSSANQLALAEDGYTLSPTLASFIDTICQVIAIPDGVLYVEGDRIVLNVQKLANVDTDGDGVAENNDIFDVIDSFMGLAGQDPISGLIPDGIAGKLEIVFFEGGLKSIDVSGSVSPDNTQGLNAFISINNFLIGVEDGELAQRIDEGIGDQSGYTSNLGELLSSALAGININMNLALTFDAGTYNLGDFLSGFGLGELEGVPLSWTFENEFVMDLTLSVQLSLAEEEPMLAVEIIANEPIYIGGSSEAQPAGLLVGIYGFYDDNNVGHVAVDLSTIKLVGISLPKLSAQLDFYGLIMGLLDDLTVDFGSGAQSLGDISLAFDISGLLGGSAEEGSAEQTQALAEAIVENPGESVNDTELTPLGALLVGLNTEELYANFTLAAILQLLEAMDVSLGDVDLSAIEIGGEIHLSRLDGVTIEAEGTLMPKQNTDVTDQNLHLLLQTGTADYPFAIGLTTELQNDLRTKTGAIESALADYREDVIAMVIGMVAKSHISLEMNLSTLDSHMDLTAIINNILASQGKQLNLPIDMYLDDWDPTVTLDLGWDLEVTDDGNIGRNSKISLSLVYQGKELLGVGLEDGDAVVRLKGLGLFNIRLNDSPLIETLIEMIQGIISDIDSMELGDLLDGLLSDLNGDPVDIDPAAANASSSSALAMADGDAEATADSAALADWIVVLLQSISATNTNIMVDLTMDMVDEIIKGLAGFSLGIDIGAAVEVDAVNGAITLDLQINDNITFGAVLTIDLGSEDYEVDIGTDATYINGTDGESIAQGLFDSLELNLSIDILNNTPDTGNANEYLRLSIQRLLSATALPNTGGYVAPAGTFLITIAEIDDAAYNNTRGGLSSGFVYAVLDYNASKISIKMREGWLEVLSGIVDVGSIINEQNLSIELVDANGVGIIGQIGSLLDGLIDDLKAMGDTTTDTTTDAEGSGGDSAPVADTPAETADTTSTLDTTAFTELFAQLDIMELLGGGIDISFNATGTFNADIAFDPYTINKLIDDLMNLIFGANSVLDLSQLAPDMFTEHHLRNVTWSRTGGFYDNLMACVKDKIIPDVVASPLVTDAVGINLAPLLGLAGLEIDAILEDLKPIITAILPFPVFNELNAGLNFVDGTLANIYITGYDRGQAVVSSDGTQLYPAGRNTNNKMELWIYNQFTSVGAGDNVVDGSPQGIVDWGDIPKTVIYEPYQYSGVNAFAAEYFQGKTARYQYGRHVMRSSVSFTFGNNSYGLSGDVYNAIASGSALDNIAAGGGTGDNPIPITVTANFTGQTWTIEIYLQVNSTASEIESVEPISLYAYSNLPDYLTLNFVDGTSRMVSWEAVQSHNIAPTAYTAHTVTASITFKNKTTVNDVEVNYLDSTAHNLINSDGLTMSVDLYAMTASSTTITEFTPEVLYFNYPDGAAVAMPVDAWENTDELNAALAARSQDPDNMSAISGVITAVIGRGKGAEQKINIAVNIRTKNVTSVMFGEFRNAIQINPYDVYLQQLHPDDPSYTVLPSQAVAYYNEGSDSYNEQVYISIDFETGAAINYDEIAWNSAQETQANVSLNKSKYGGYYGWTMGDIPVNVVLNRISKVWFVDEDSPSGYSNVLKIDPYVYNSLATKEEKEAFFPTTALIEFSNGVTRELPIRFVGLDFEDLYADYDSFNDQYQLQIGFVPADLEGVVSDAVAFEKRFSQTTYVYFEFEGKQIDYYRIDGYAHDGNAQYLEIDPVAVLLQGQSPLPSSVEVVYTDGTSEVIDVYLWDSIAIESSALNDQDGSTGTVVGNLTADWQNSFTINYRIAPRYGMRAEDIVFDSFDYTLRGSAITFDVLTDMLQVKFKDGTTTEVTDEEAGTTETIETEHSYFINISTWETGGANFGSTDQAGGFVTAVFNDFYNEEELTLDVNLEADTTWSMKKDEADNIDVTYLGLDYILVMCTMDADGNVTSVFDNHEVTDTSEGKTFLSNVMVSVLFQDGNGNQTWRVLKADIELGNDIPKSVDDVNRGGYTLFDYSTGSSPSEQKATEFNATVSIYDGSNTIVATAALPLYFGYNGAANA